MVDKIDLALLKQEIVDWHDVATENCLMLKTQFDRAWHYLSLNDEFKPRTPEQIAGFELGVELAMLEFKSLPFDIENQGGIEGSEATGVKANHPRITHCRGIPIQQIKLVSTILLEISSQHLGIEISDAEFSVIVNAANSICSAFLVKEGDHND